MAVLEVTVEIRTLMGVRCFFYVQDSIVDRRKMATPDMRVLSRHA